VLGGGQDSKSPSTGHAGLVALKGLFTDTTAVEWGCSIERRAGGAGNPCCTRPRDDVSIPSRRGGSALGSSAHCAPAGRRRSLEADDSGTRHSVSSSRSGVPNARGRRRGNCGALPGARSLQTSFRVPSARHDGGGRTSASTEAAFAARPVSYRCGTPVASAE
jgi:hypothetical protein